ncbi:MAG: hypothetical protein V3W20_07540 [Candidatus Neomarinimicrobiota bacterium]
MKGLFKFMVFVALVFCVPLLLYATKMSNIVYADTDKDSMNFAISIDPLLTISGLGDMGATDPVGDVSEETNACVYSNISSGTTWPYYVMADGTQDISGNFRLYSATTSEYVIYTAYWKDLYDGPVLTELVPETWSVAYWKTDHTSRTCADMPGGVNSTLNIRISAAAIAAVDAGDYSDTLIINVRAADL